MPRKNKGNFAVIGGGIAGTCIAELIAKKGFNITLFEKSKTLGGCAGSFTRDGYTFNTAATTIAGLLEGYSVREILEEFKLTNLIEIEDPSIVVHTEKGRVNRYQSIERTVEEINKVFPHRRNKEFWRDVKAVTEEILKYGFYHNFSTLRDGLLSFYRMRRLIYKYYRLFLKPAIEGLKDYFSSIDREYLRFMDSHVKIVAQSSIENVNMVTLFLSLGYPFTGVGYAKNGMGEIVKEIAKNFSYHLNSEIISVSKNADGFKLKGAFGEERFDNLIIAMPILESLNILQDSKIKAYFEKYLSFQTDNSAIVAYGVLENFYPENTFHLTILRKCLPYTTSPYLFFSFFPAEKNKGECVFTVSTHTSINYWHGLKREDYENRKQNTHLGIIENLLEFFPVKRENIKMSFLSTPETFYRYLGRRSVGGIPITLKNTFWRIPSNFTPFHNLYLVGDSFFCYQGWIGITMGIKNLIGKIGEQV
ncbi:MULTISPECIES: phytoene desaturase family protein [Thermodesulfovibrio]|jgi:phytoene dehydrogenase-like protein|uniref:phytoene desaturase family protein n=1 Tax=Thermodesulfovibrio TaxID=28261 RepID=UPI00260532DF|nr:NAD(P)/FAD-dependent oxidoreductase [Thermodesulfovibrio sp.]